jgi:hypothetical protein
MTVLRMDHALDRSVTVSADDGVAHRATSGRRRRRGVRTPGTAPCSGAARAEWFAFRTRHDGTAALADHGRAALAAPPLLPAVWSS